MRIGDNTAHLILMNKRSGINKLCGIYTITNTITGARYIGQSVNIKDRKRNHINNLKKGDHYNRHLQHSFNKYGEEYFIFDIVLLCEPENLIYYEQQLVNSTDNIYNECKQCVASVLGIKRTSETKKKLSVAATGRIPSDDARKAMSKAWITRKISEESKKRMSISQLGRKHSEETKAKMPESRKKFWESEDNRKHLSNIKIEQWSNPEFREKMTMASQTRRINGNSME